jgi:Nucleotidyl transferase AbiEii toxin, Type IV TA system
LLPLAASQLGLNEELIEKDFWVTEILRALQYPPDGVHVIFKGGTSLSKGFQLIQRMSEDVDILLHGKLSGANRKRVLQELTARVSKHIGLTAVAIRDEGDRKLVSRFVYGDRTMEIGTPGVLLELGFRGHPQPTHTVEMTSYLADYIATLSDASIQYQELEPVTLDLLAPERTLLEKIFALHCAAADFPKTAEQVRVLARYYYDVKFLLDDANVRSGVTALGNLDTYCKEELVNAGVGAPFPGPERPAGGYAESVAFHPTAPLLAVLAPAYEAALRFVFMNTPQPALQECIDTVIQWGSLL